MTKIRGAVESFLGVCVLVASLTFVGFILKEGGFKAKELAYFKADFDSVDGLSRGSLVKINGVVVGHVHSIELDKDSAVVSFGIDKKIALPKDTLAAIISESLLGGKFLNLVLGSEEALLAENSTIYQTESAVSLEQLLQKFLFHSTEDKNKDKESKEEHKEESLDTEPKEDAKESKSEGLSDEAKTDLDEMKKNSSRELFLEGLTPRSKEKTAKEAALEESSQVDPRKQIQESVYHELQDQIRNHFLKTKTLIS